MASALSAFRDTPAAGLNTEEKLLADFRRDPHPNKVCLATRGEWAPTARVSQHSYLRWWCTTSKS